MLGFDTLVTRRLHPQILQLSLNCRLQVPWSSFLLLTETVSAFLVLKALPH